MVAIAAASVDGVLMALTHAPWIAYLVPILILLLGGVAGTGRISIIRTTASIEENETEASDSAADTGVQGLRLVEPPNEPRERTDPRRKAHTCPATWTFLWS